MALRTEQKLPIILFIVFLIITMFGILFYQSTTSLQQALVAQRQTNHFLTLTDEVMTMCLDSETGVRGFMFTGVDTYLDGFSRAKAKIPQNLAQLRTYSVDDPESLERIENLKTAVDAFSAELDRKVEFRKINGWGEVTMGQIVVPDDKARLDNLRRARLDLTTLEASQQQASDASLDRGLTRTVWILIVGSIAGALALTLANFVVFRESRKRASAEIALIDANKGLEEKVESRTTELTVMNERLIEIGGERELLLKQEQASRKEAEIANRLRDEFMATVSHELRTPLNSILGWARLMKEGGLNENQSERALTTIIKNSETQNRLIEDLLDVARLISGKLELDHANVGLIDVVAESIEIAKPAADAKKLAVESQHDNESEAAVIVGDRNRLRQVFSNLLTNAIKFSHDGDRIWVSVGVEDLEGVIKVRDEGIGISKDFLPLVFERFRQDMSVANRNGGLGLGLAIVRNLVEIHGGSVSVESDGENTGAEFTVRLPLAQN